MIESLSECARSRFSVCLRCAYVEIGDGYEWRIWSYAALAGERVDAWRAGRRGLGQWKKRGCEEVLVWYRWGPVNDDGIKHAQHNSLAPVNSFLPIEIHEYTLQRVQIIRTGGTSYLETAGPSAVRISRETLPAATQALLMTSQRPLRCR